MSEHWFYRVFGEEFGPVSLSDLRESAMNGTLSGDDEVRPEALSMWVPAKAVRELQEYYQDAVESSSTVSITMNTATAVSDEWYFRMTDDDGVEVGPLTFDALIELAKSGRLTSDDEVRLGVDSKWRRAGSMGRLVAVLPYQTRRRRNTAPLPETQVDSLKEMMAALPEVVSEVATSEASEEVLPEVVSEVPIVERKTPRPKSKLAVKKSTKPVVAEVDGPVVTDADDALSAERAQDIEDQILDELMKPTASVPVPGVSAAMSIPESRPVSPSPPPVAAAQESWNSNSAPSSSSFSRSTSMPTARKPAAPYKPARSGPSFAEHFKNPAIWKGLAALVVLGMLVGWMNMTPGKGADVSRYRELDALFAELKELREKDKEGKKFMPFKDKFLQTAKRIQQEVEPTAGADFPARQRLLWTTKNCMPEMSGSLVTETPAEKQALMNLEQAAIALGLKDAPKLEIAGGSIMSD